MLRVIVVIMIYTQVGYNLHWYNTFGQVTSYNVFISVYNKVKPLS